MKIKFHLARIECIVNMLNKNNYPSKEDIFEKLNHRFADLLDERAGITESTFNRDKKLITEMFNFEVEYSKKDKGYFIEKSGANKDDFERLNRVIEFVQKNNAADYGNIVQLERSYIKGLEYLNSVLHCIDLKKRISFEYENFIENTVESHKIAPAFVKEFKRRMYVIGTDVETSQVNSYSFDRISKFKTLDEDFKENPLTKDHLKDCFGIVNYHDCPPPQRILLKAYGLKVKYLKTQPLHHSQKLIEEKNDYSVFELFVKPTYDFIIEIMSHSHQLEVLEPEYLRNEVKWRLEDTLKFYQNKN